MVKSNQVINYVYQIISKRKAQFLLLLILSVFLGFYNIDGFELSNDELITLNVTTGFGLQYKEATFSSTDSPQKYFTPSDYWKRNTIGNVLSEINRDNGNMSLYQIFIHCIIKLIGVKDLILRGISAIFYILSVLLLYQFASKLYGDGMISFLASTMFSINPLVIYYAHQIRSYTFTLMLLMIFSILLQQMNNRKTNQKEGVLPFILMYSVIFVSGFLSHFIVIFNLTATSFWGLLHFNRKNKIILAASILISASILIFWFLLYGQTGLTNMNIKGGEIYKILGSKNQTTLLSLIQGIASLFNSQNGYIFQYLGYRNRDFFFFGFLPASILLLGFFNYKAPSKYIKDNLFIILNIILPIVLLCVLAIITKHNTMFLPRYIVFTLPFYCILLAHSVKNTFVQRNFRIRRLTVVLILFHLSFNFYCYKIPFEGKIVYYDGEENRITNDRILKSPPIKNLYAYYATEIVKEYKKGNIVVFNSTQNAQFTNLYLPHLSTHILQTIDTSQEMPILIKKIK